MRSKARRPKCHKTANVPPGSTQPRDRTGEADHHGEAVKAIGMSHKTLLGSQELRQAFSTRSFERAHFTSVSLRAAGGLDPRTVAGSEAIALLRRQALLPHFAALDLGVAENGARGM
jgi:hypothetical protein